MPNSSENNEDLQAQLLQIKAENQKLKTKLEELTEGGGIKIFFSDKAQAKQIIYRVKPRVLKELPRYSFNPERSPNLIIEGDNLQALASLSKYRHKVDLILTDPPYNTGKDFRYNDKWNEDPNDEGLGNLIKVDDPSRHTKWMKFMLPRLIVMRGMLKDSGVLAICIDEREIFNLGKMLDEVFGENNRIAIINWQKAYAPKNQMKHISPSTEYVLIYARDFEKVKTARVARSQKALKYYKNVDNDPKGSWRPTPIHAGPPSPSNVYVIQSPFTGVAFFPVPGTSWRWKKSKIRKWLEEWGSEYEEKKLGNEANPGLYLKGYSNQGKKDEKILVEARKKALEILKKGSWPKLIFGKDGNGKPDSKRYLSEVAEGIPATTYWASEDFSLPELGSISLPFKESGHSQEGVRELMALIDKGRDFIGVKPLKLFTKIIQLWCPPNGLVLDPFAGTGTTGHAILQLNHTEKTNRSFILIEQGNPKNGDTFARTLLYPRLKAAITGKWADNKPHEPLKGTFKYSKLTKQIDSATILEMEKEELTDAILSVQLNAVPLPNNNYLIAKNSQNEGIYLIWDGEKKRESKVTEKTYRQCALENKKHKLIPVYHIYARTQVYSPKTIQFHKIPDHLLLEFGISPEAGLKTKKVKPLWK